MVLVREYWLSAYNRSRVTARLPSSSRCVADGMRGQATDYSESHISQSDYGEKHLYV